VVATDGTRTARAQLDSRFQLAVDEAAMRAGLSETDDYLAEWHRDTRMCGDDLEREVAAEIARLEEEFSPHELDRLVDTGGLRSGAAPAD